MGFFFFFFLSVENNSVFKIIFTKQILKVWIIWKKILETNFENKLKIILKMLLNQALLRGNGILNDNLKSEHVNPDPDIVKNHKENKLTLRR